MNIYEGQYTSHIYGLIKDQNYDEAIRILNSQLEMNPRSRAALSLLGYCNYLSQNYLAAAEMYEQLIKYYPEVVEYRVYLAQSLYKAENYLEALKACQNIDKPELSHQITILQFASKYQMNDLNNAHVLLDNSDPEREETLICQGCVLYKENKFEESKVKFEEAKALCSSPSIDYNIAVCYYKLKQISATNQYLSNIMEYAAKAHPDLVLTTKVEGIKTTSVANSSSLYESCLIEAYNLRAAILYLISVEEARNTLNDMPPRDEEELDSVTLHNLALVNIDKDPDDSFKKMNFLLKVSLINIRILLVLQKHWLIC